MCLWRFTNFQTSKIRQLNPYARLVEKDLGVRGQGSKFQRLKHLTISYIFLYYILLYYTYIILYHIIILYQHHCINIYACQLVLRERIAPGENKSNIGDLSNIIGLSYSPIF